VPCPDRPWHQVVHRYVHSFQCHVRPALTLTKRYIVCAFASVSCLDRLRHSVHRYVRSFQCHVQTGPDTHQTLHRTCVRFGAMSRPAQTLNAPVCAFYSVQCLDRLWHSPSPIPVCAFASVPCLDRLRHSVHRCECSLQCHVYTGCGTPYTGMRLLFCAVSRPVLTLTKRDSGVCLFFGAMFILNFPSIVSNFVLVLCLFPYVRKDRRVLI
jgi:hypothetical protein